MRHDIEETLSRVLWDESEAIRVVRGSGFRLGSIPAWRSPAVFWSKVVSDVTNGAPPGLTPFLEAVYRATQSPEVYALLSGADERVDAIAMALARTFTEPLEARQMAQRAGLGSVPAFHDPLSYWTGVVNSACSGAASVVALLQEARRMRPYNQAIVALHEDVMRSPIRPASPPSDMAPTARGDGTASLDAAMASIAARLPGDPAVAKVMEAVAEARDMLAHGHAERARAALR